MLNIIEKKIGPKKNFFFGCEIFGATRPGKMTFFRAIVEVQKKFFHQVYLCYIYSCREFYTDS